MNCVQSDCATLEAWSLRRKAQARCALVPTCVDLSGTSSRAMKFDPTASCTARMVAASPAGSSLVTNSSPTSLQIVSKALRWSHSIGTYKSLPQTCKAKLSYQEQ